MHVQRDIPQTALVLQFAAVGIESRLVNYERQAGPDPNGVPVFKGEGKRRLKEQLEHVEIVRARQIAVEGEILVLQFQAGKRRIRVGQLLGDLIARRTALFSREDWPREQDPHRHHYGHEIVDPYHWLRDDERADSEVLAYLHAENDYTEAMTEATTASISSDSGRSK